MKMIAAVPSALVAIAILGCTQHASTAPAVASPPPASANDTNMFGENKDAGASNAERARAENYGKDASAPAGENPAPADSTAGGTAPPK